MGEPNSYTVKGAIEFPQVVDVLGDSLPAGRYALGAVVQVGADTVAVPAGLLPLSADTRPPLQAPALLTYAAETRVAGVAPSHLVARVVATNPTNRNVYLEYGACVLHLRAYRSAERTGKPVWRSEYRRPPARATVEMIPSGGRFKASIDARPAQRVII